MIFHIGQKVRVKQMCLKDWGKQFHNVSLTIVKIYEESVFCRVSYVIVMPDGKTHAGEFDCHLKELEPCIISRNVMEILNS